MRTLAQLVAALLVCAGAQAQTVYRCGPDGRVYSQTPCPQGKAVDVGDERSAEQRQAALDRAREDQVRGDDLERERLRRESGKPPLAGKIDGRPAPVERAASAPKAKSPKKKRRAKHETGDFKAVAPAAKKPKS